MGDRPASPSPGSPFPELSSINSALDDLTRRVTAIAEASTGTEGEELAMQLFDVERSLTQARRRLTVLIGGQTGR